MFLIVGFLIGLNLMTRVGIGEVRELKAAGQARGAGQSSLAVGDILKIALKAGIFLVVPMILGQLLDMAFGSTLVELFD